MPDNRDDSDDARKFIPAAIMTPERLERMRRLWASGAPLDSSERLAEIEFRLSLLEEDQDLMDEKLEVLKALVLDLVKVLTEMREAACGLEDGGGDGRS